MDLQFEWDDAKASANVKKHGVAFDEGLTAFADPLARTFDDPDHSEGELRELMVGFSTKSRLRAPSDKGRAKRHEENVKPK